MTTFVIVVIISIIVTIITVKIACPMIGQMIINHERRLTREEQLRTMKTLYEALKIGLQFDRDCDKIDEQLSNLRDAVKTISNIGITSEATAVAIGEVFKKRLIKDKLIDGNRTLKKHQQTKIYKKKDPIVHYIKEMPSLTVCGLDMENIWSGQTTTNKNHPNMCKNCQRTKIFKEK